MKKTCETCENWVEFKGKRICWERDSDNWLLETDPDDTCLDRTPKQEDGS